MLRNVKIKKSMKKIIKYCIFSLLFIPLLSQEAFDGYTLFTPGGGGGGASANENADTGDGGDGAVRIFSW